MDSSPTIQWDQLVDLNDCHKFLQDRFGEAQLFLDSKALTTVLLHDQFHGGTVLAVNEETKSEAHVSIFKYHEIYRVKLKAASSFLSRLLDSLRRNAESSDVKSLCILYGVRCTGPDGVYLLRQVIREAHNKCLYQGATYVGMVYNMDMDASEVAAEKITLDSDFSLIGKPISEGLPKLKGKAVFVDPRW